MENTAGALGAKEPRHNQLLNVVGQLANIKIRLNELKESLGVTNPRPEVDAKPPTEVSPGNLVEAMNRLPVMISVEVDQIHKSLDELNEALI